MISGSTLIYIRPMKSSLSVEKVNPVSTSSSPSTTCASCKKQVPILNLRQHSVDFKPISIEIDAIDSFSDEELNDNESQEQEAGPSDVHTRSNEAANSSQTWSSQLKFAFPDATDGELEEITSCAMSIDEAACFLLDKQSSDVEGDASLEDLVDQLAKKNYLPTEESLEVDRETLWIDIIKFYKKSLMKPDALQRELSVSFINEEGLDGGALKVEFFLLALKEIKNRLFEGTEPNMVPVKDATKGILFHIAGMIISHAVCQKCAIGFPILAPHIYAHIIGQSDDEIAPLMKKEYIPLDASTSLLHDLLTGLDLCKNGADILALLEGNEKSDAFWQLINSSRWPKEKLVDITTREFLCQHLVYNELLTSRKNEISEFKEGLKSLGFVDLLLKNTEKCKALLCATEHTPFTPDILKDMMLTILPQNFAENQSHEWFLDYIRQGEDEEFPEDSRLRSLLQFWTGWNAVPFGGLTKRLKVTFLNDDDTYHLPTSSACLALLRIPTVHSSKKKFFQAMDIALKFAKVGFHNP